MISLRLVVPAVLGAAAVAGCVTYFIAPSPRVEADQRVPQAPLNLPAPGSEVSKGIAQHPSAKEKGVAAFEKAADAILKRAAYGAASAGERPITGPIPLPRRRPIPRR